MSGEFQNGLIWAMFGIPVGVCSVLYNLFGNGKMTLQDKVVLITGASGGLGAALSEVFYEAGCKVILSGRQSKSLERVRDKLSSKRKPKCHVPEVLVMDLTETADIPEKMNKAVAIFGHIDILINNAGMGSRGWIYQTDLEVYEKVMKVNYLGQIHVTKALLPHMMERKSGHIVIISSIGGKYGIHNRAPYIGSKHALGGFSESLRAELSLYNINVTTICTPQIRTNFSINAMDADGSAYNKMDKATETGLDPMYVARETLNSTVNRKEEVLIAPLYFQLFICLKTMAPSLFFKIVKVLARKDAKQLDLPFAVGKKVNMTSRL